MAVKLIYQMLVKLPSWMALHARSDNAKEIEILVLRHQLAVLQLRTPRPRLSWSDRSSPIHAPLAWRSTDQPVIGQAHGSTEKACTVCLDPLRDERSAFHDNAAATSNAIHDLLHRVHNSRRSRDEEYAVLQALVLVADKQTDALASLDRFVLHARELGLSRDARADLQRGRVDLSQSLGIILRDIARAERLLGRPVDG